MIIGSKIFHNTTVNNSLDWAQKNIDNAPDGSIFIADEHKVTRGRLGQNWVFDKEQLVVTILLKPNVLKTIPRDDFGMRLNQLNMSVTLGVLEVLKQYDIDLKWPNDFYFQDKKVGGLIAKTIWSGSKPKAVIFGFALNLNNVSPVLNSKLYRAISLSEIIGSKLDKEFLFNEILRSIDTFYQDWLCFKYANIFKKWKKAQGYIGKMVNVHKQDGKLVEGLFLDVTDDGTMLLRTETDVLEISSFLVETIL